MPPKGYKRHRDFTPAERAAIIERMKLYHANNPARVAVTNGCSVAAINQMWRRYLAEAPPGRPVLALEELIGHAS